MPRYDFKCTKCDHVFEVVCKIAELNDPKVCPQCSESETERYFGNQSNSAIPPDRLGRMKTPDGFKDVLRNIADRTPGGKVLHDKIR